MGPQDILESVQPLAGEVTPIRTVQETQPVEEYGAYRPQVVRPARPARLTRLDDAYVAGVHVKSAAKVVK